MELIKSLKLLDYVSLALIAVHLVLLYVNRGMLPFGFDTPYHLLMGKMYADFDRVVLWDYYEFAPVGRPQLYPPFEHVLIWWMHDGFGLDYVEIGRLIAIVQYPVTLFLSWLVVRLLFDDVTAASFLGLLSADGRFWSWQLTVAPTALILALYMPFLYFFVKKRKYAATALLTIFLYSHLGMPYTIILSLLISVLLMRSNYVKEAAFVICLSLVLFLPWAIHVLSNLDALRANIARGKFKVLGFLSMDIPLLFLLPIGVYACYKEKPKGSLLIGSFLGFFSILLTYGWRYFIHAPLINSAVAAVGYRKALTKTSRKVVVSVTLVFLALNSLFSLSLFGVGAGGLRGPGFLEPAPLVRELTTMVSEEPKAWGKFGLNNPDLIAVANWIAENTEEDEIIHVMVGSLADAITLLTGRRTDHGMYPEVRTEEMFAAISQGRKSGIFVLTRDQFDKMRFFSIKSEVLAVFGEFIIVYATGELRPTDILAKPISLYIRLPSLENGNQELLKAWLDLVNQISPKKVSVGVHQKDLRNPVLQSFLIEIKEIAGELELSVLMVNPDTIKEDIGFLISLSGDQVDSLRVLARPGLITPDLLNSVREEIGHRELGLGVIGLPGEELTRWRDPDAILEQVDYLVRHVPPSADFILHAVEADVEELERLDIKKPIFVQIDLSRIKMKEINVPILNLIAAIHQTKASGIILEFNNPYIASKILEILRVPSIHTRA